MAKKPKDEALRARVRQYVNRHMSNLLRRSVYILLFVTIQIGIVVWVFLTLDRLTPYFLVFCTLLSFFSAIFVINKNTNPSYKIAWLIPILAAPIFGGLLYLMFGTRRVNRRFAAVTEDVRKKYKLYESKNRVDVTCEGALPRYAALQSAYIERASGCFAYANTQTQYYPSGEEMGVALLSALKGARRYIFLEFFIIEEGEFWDAVLEILTEKVRAGVEVRVMYDDFGCLAALPVGYEKTLRERGIRCHVFNPFNTVLSPRPNNRDHRKIAVIDGVCAFVGGTNIADEYINLYERFGYWKDTAISIFGDAAFGVCMQFLSVWDADTHEVTDAMLYSPKYVDAKAEPISARGIVQPYTDIPMDDEQVGKTVYFNMIARAERYLYITTPYLILDQELVTALQTAAKSGVDVRIITPHIPDKKSVFLLTRSYYKPLLDAGVKVYEFTPGFVHAKMMVSDDRFAVVGSINLDYRSLYLHLENAVWMYDTDTVFDIRDDFLLTQAQSMEIGEDVLGKMTVLKRLWLSVLRTFAPLM